MTEEKEKERRTPEGKKRKMQYNNKWIAEKYDRISVVAPDGTKEKIKLIVGDNGSINGYICAAIYDAIARDLPAEQKK